MPSLGRGNLNNSCWDLRESTMTLDNFSMVISFLNSCLGNSKSVKDISVLRNGKENSGG